MTTRRRPPATWVGLGLGLVLVAAGAVLLWSRAAYGMWPWAAYPGRLHYCGRDYAPSGTETLEQIDKAVGPPHRAGELPGFLNSGEIWTVNDDPSMACGTVVYVRLSENRFEAMSLEGGP